MSVSPGYSPVVPVLGRVSSSLSQHYPVIVCVGNQPGLNRGSPLREQLQESQPSREKSLAVVVGFHREESTQAVGFCFLTGGKRWIFLH